MPRAVLYSLAGTVFAFRQKSTLMNCQLQLLPTRHTSYFVSKVDLSRTYFKVIAFTAVYERATLVRVSDCG